MKLKINNIILILNRIIDETGIKDVILTMLENKMS